MEKKIGDLLTEAEDSVNSWWKNLANAAQQQEQGAVRQARELYTDWTTGHVKEMLLRGRNDNGREYGLLEWTQLGDEIGELLNQEIDLVKEFGITAAVEHTVTDTVTVDYVTEKAHEAVEQLAEPWSFQTKAVIVGGLGLATLGVVAWSLKQFRMAAAVVGVA